MGGEVVLGLGALRLAATSGEAVHSPWLSVSQNCDLSDPQVFDKAHLVP